MISEVAIEEIDDMLYGKRDGRKPIRAISYGKQMTWFPKANEGQKWTSEDALDAVKYGVWGGTVEGYGRGFNEQKTWLHFIGFDVDHKNGENIGWTAAGLRSAVIEAVGKLCAIRTSSSGNGYHLFYLLKTPVECANKATAQKLAAQLGNKLVLPRLTANRVTVDKAACNQLWVLGGKQAWIEYGQRHQVAAEDLVVETVTPAKPGAIEVAGEFGEWAAEFLGLLAKQGAAKSLTHLTLIKRAVVGTRWEKYFADYASGENTEEPNCAVSVIDGSLRVYSFRHEKTLYSQPVGM